ncbi:MAG TPA: hypothetical protein VEQ40_01950 [Pyrinomonadaceae bacterium]|nr:hypothetical protein [Pyrinomonadaceae bacterium]
MNLTNLVESGTKELGMRFNLIGLLPSTFLFLFVTALYWSGAPATAPNLPQVYERVKDLEAKESIIIVIVLLVFSLLVHPLQLSLVKILEGYWGGVFPLTFFSRLGTKRHRKRRTELESLTLFAKAPTAKQEALAKISAQKLRSSYPAEDRVLPTLLGNVMRAAEDFPDKRYGLDAVVFWPRLYPLLPESMSAILTDQRNQLDLAARLCATFLFATIIAIAFLYGQGWWLILPAITLLLAWLSYRAAIAAALAYGIGLQTAFDLYRFDLLKALHLALPADRTTEKKHNRELSDFMRQGVPVNLQYKHP